MREPAVCICESKDTDELHSNHAFVFVKIIAQSLYFVNLNSKSLAHFCGRDSAHWHVIVQTCHIFTSEKFLENKNASNYFIVLIAEKRIST